MVTTNFRQIRFKGAKTVHIMQHMASGLYLCIGTVSGELSPFLGRFYKRTASAWLTMVMRQSKDKTMEPKVVSQHVDLDETYTIPDMPEEAVVDRKYCITYHVGKGKKPKKVTTIAANIDEAIERVQEGWRRLGTGSEVIDRVDMVL